MIKAYFISGIGADYRLFTHTRLPEGYEKAYIHYIPPIAGESLPDYALRLTEQIDTSQPFVLVGLSLGGIMAVEIAKRFPPKCTILISSIPLSSQMPPFYRLGASLGLTQIVPPSFVKAATAVKHFLTMKEAEKRKIMFDVIRSGDDDFIRWGLEAVLKWENTTIPQPLYHIHGSRDEIFPISRTRPTHIVQKGSHMIVMSRTEEINALLSEILGEQTQIAKAS